MKLRNKKTGEVVEFLCLDLVDDDKIEFEYIQRRCHENSLSYGSLEKFTEEWEDYKPVEPLIKDEKIRKAVRAWAEANGVGRAIYMENNYRFFADDTEVGSMIEFEKMPENTGLKNEHSYTITELCGPSDSEEEE